jgi:hypothetical protein
MRRGWLWLWTCVCGWAFALSAFAEAPSSLTAQGIAVGQGASVASLTVFPLFGSSEVELGEITSLEDALSRKQAVVREVAGGEVNKLQIRNRGKTPVYVLAGTLVKGGNQDRQIGQDFVIEPGQSVAVDAFCVEQGRWSGTREGRGTGGAFVAAQAIATADVRRAAQYAQDQGEVWNKVGKVNEAHKKSSPSGTLMATLDAGDVAARKRELVRQIEQALPQTQAGKPLVGLAYALRGSMRSVRWFANAKVFGLFRTRLVEAAALDELTARVDAQAGPAAAPAKLSDVDAFVSDVEAQQAAMQRDTPAANVNEYKESKRGFGSKTRLKARPSVSISNDYVVKEK